MPYKHTRTEEFLHVEWHGKLTNGDLVALSKELPQLAAALGFTPHVLHTFEEVTGAQIEPWSVFEHSVRHRDITLKNRARSAWVTRTPQVRRIGQLFQELNRNPDLEIELFEVETTAKAWLRSSTGRKVQKKRRAAAR